LAPGKQYRLCGGNKLSEVYTPEGTYQPATGIEALADQTLLLFYSGLCQRDKLQRSDVVRLWTLLALGNFHGHFLTFMKRSATRAIDSAEVNEHIFATFLLDETKTLLIIEPLNGTLN